jgi:hypothetical protein
MTRTLNAIGYGLIELGDWLDMPVLTGWLYRIGAKLELME